MTLSLDSTERRKSLTSNATASVTTMSLSRELDVRSIPEVDQSPRVDKLPFIRAKMWEDRLLEWASYKVAQKTGEYGSAGSSSIYRNAVSGNRNDDQIIPFSAQASDTDYLVRLLCNEQQKALEVEYLRQMPLLHELTKLAEEEDDKRPIPVSTHNSRVDAAKVRLEELRILHRK